MAKRSKKRKWLLGGLLTVLLLIFLIVLGKYWIIPAVIRSQAGSALATRWRGDIEIRNVDFNYFGPVRLGGVTVSDDQGREWILVEDITADWTFLGILSPALESLHVKKPHLHAFLKDGKVDWPLKEPEEEEPEEPMERIWPEGLEAVVVEEFRMTIHEEDGQVRQVKPVDLALIREGDKVNTDVKVLELADDQRIELTGNFGAEDNVADLELHLHRRFPAPWSRFILATLEVPVLKSAYGLVTTRGDTSEAIEITGDLLRSEDLHVLGEIRMENWLVHTSYAQLLRNFQTHVILTESEDLLGNPTRVITIKKTTGDAGPGTVGMEQSEIVLNRDWSLHDLEVLARMDAPLGHFTQAVGKGSQKGNLSFTSSLRNDKIGLQGLKGTIAVQLDNGQLVGIPIISKVFNYLRAEQFNPLNLSDALGEMKISWPHMTVGQFRVASKLYAIEFRQGGRINLDTGKIEKLHVVAVPLQEVGGILGRIPGFDAVTSLPTELTKNITQLEVTGNAFEPASVQVQPLVGAELAGETFKFLKSTVSSGGNLVGQALEPGSN